MNSPADNMVPLDWRHMPLDGRVLIEASAGTGKTYVIALIYLRLLIERDLRVEQIVVATFTEPAARELRRRLHARLVDAERLLSADTVAHDASQSADPLADWLADIARDSAARETALRRIRLARIDLDRAPIATIHALCARIQRDFPLYSGAGFSAETLLDEGELLLECIEDFWRRRYLAGTPDAREVAALVPEGPAGLLHDLKALMTRHAEPFAANGLAELDRRAQALTTPATLDQLCALTDRSLYKRSNSKLRNRLRAIVDAIDAGMNVEDVVAEELKKGGFDPLTIDADQADNARLRLRDHPLIVALRELYDLLKHHDGFVRGAVLADALQFCRDELPRRARARNAQTYAMQIDGVYRRLRDDTAGLAQRLFETFPVALIDEFQDTDAHQFEIFDRIYRDETGNPRGLVTMVGDPKQAIFAFRGGDIAAYLHASAEVTQRFSLELNYRSASALVAAMNGLYGDAGEGFDNPAIRYRRVRPSPDADAEPYLCDGRPPPAALMLHRFRSGIGTGSRAGLVELENLALDDCAERIVELLNDGSRCIHGRRIGPGDIAVLLNTNRQILELRKRLIRRHVPCTGSGRSNVFDTDMARELELILYAVLNPDDDRAVRGALTTRLLGADLSALCDWQRDERAFETELQRFAGWHRLAVRRGVLAVIQAILEQRTACMLVQATGERDLTDLRHLGELLAEQEPSRHGLSGLYAWFAAARRDGSEVDLDAADARQLRIESDGARVQLLTVHMSKGLEFPIVFLPLAWRISSRAGQHAPKTLFFHDAAGRPRVDLGSADFEHNLGMHFREDLQERLRLLYVALTRASKTVHVYWADRGAPGGDAELWNVAGIDVLIHAAQTHLDLRFGEAALDTLARKLPGVGVIDAAPVGVSDYRSATATSSTMAARRPLPSVRAFEWLHSFSALMRRAAPDEPEPAAADESEFVALPSVDEAIAGFSGEPQDARLLQLDVWRGRRFGDAVHKMFETAGAGRIWPEQRDFVAAQLSLQAVRPAPGAGNDALEPVARMIDRVRNADLGDGLRLANLDVNSRVAEFEFQFPVHVRLDHLRAVCAEYGFADTVPVNLSASQLRGMLTGFADLIFEYAGRYHVLDYKTNRLGLSLADYRQAALDNAMVEHHYDLQALIYTVALHRYLRQRLPGYSPPRHLGENWYLFLRGVGLEPGLGVWRRVWPVALIEQLDDAFAGSLENAA